MTEDHATATNSPWAYILPLAPWARTVALRCRGRWPQGYLLEDLVHEAMAHAAQYWRYDAEHEAGASPRTYAAHLIAYGVADTCANRDPDESAKTKTERQRMRRWARERRRLGLSARLRDYQSEGVHSPRWLELAWRRPITLSLDGDTIRHEDGGERVQAAILRALSDVEAPQRIEEGADTHRDLERLRGALAALDERQAQVIVWRYFDGLHLQGCGERIGRSRERVRQIELRALQLLRAAMRAA